MSGVLVIGGTAVEVADLARSLHAELELLPEPTPGADGATASAARAVAEGSWWFSSVRSTAASIIFCVMRAGGAGGSHHGAVASAVASTAMISHCHCAAEGRRRYR